MAWLCGVRLLTSQNAGTALGSLKGHALQPVRASGRHDTASARLADVGVAGQVGTLAAGGDREPVMMGSVGVKHQELIIID